MLFSNTLKATAAASLLLACAGVNAQSSWKSSQDLGLYVNPTKGISSNVTIGASPTSSLSKTRLTVKSEEGQGGLRIFNSAGDTKLWLNEKGGLSVGTSSSATTNGLLVSGQTRLRANLIVDNGADIKGGMKLDGEADINGKTQINGETTVSGKTRINGKVTINCDIDKDQIAVTTGPKDFMVKGQSEFIGEVNITDNNKDSLFLNLGVRNYGSRRVQIGAYKPTNYGASYWVPLHFNADKYIFHTGDVNIEKSLQVNGYANVSKNLDCQGNITCKGQIEVAELKANDIQMDMHNAADYVFDESYNLKSLSEVESYVNEHKHLPGMPSAAEMEENGVSVSKMTNLLLEKVEELTLHMIKMESHMNELEKENAALKAKFESQNLK